MTSTGENILTYETKINQHEFKAVTPLAFIYYSYYSYSYSYPYYCYDDDDDDDAWLHTCILTQLLTLLTRLN